jgi:hypothetical protein
MSKSPLEEVIDLAGGQTGLAAKICEWHQTNGTPCRVKQAHVWKWLNRLNGVVPSEHVLAAAWATTWKKTPHHIRPDLYPHADDGLPKELRHVA